MVQVKQAYAACVDSWTDRFCQTRCDGLKNAAEKLSVSTHREMTRIYPTLCVRVCVSTVFVYTYSIYLGS